MLLKVEVIFLILSTTGVIIINELYLHDSPDVNNPKPDELVLHQDGKFTSLSIGKH